MATKIPSEPISGTVFPLIKGKPGIFVFENPPFHPNILNVGGANKATNPTLNSDFNPGGGSFHRGLIMAGAGVVKGFGGNTQYKVNFLYNPSTIQETRSLDLNNGVLPAYARNPDDPGTYATSLNTTVSFSLLFDRTYELWDKSYQSTIGGAYGVRADVEAFYNLVGINVLQEQKTAIQGPVAPPAVNTGKANNVVQGPMQFMPASLIFGHNSRGALSYFGYISSMDITYTHFNAQMVPVRCAISVGFTVLSKIASTTS